MKFHKDMLLLYAVTDRKWTGRQSLEEQIRRCAEGGSNPDPASGKESDRRRAYSGSKKNKRDLSQLSRSSDH